MTTTPLPDAEYLSHRTVAERIARGRALRKQLPPGRLARWSPSPQRTDPIAILERQGAHVEGEADIAAKGLACGQTADAFDDSSKHVTFSAESERKTPQGI